MEGSNHERRTSRRVLVTVALAAAFLMAGALPAFATAPGEIERIAFRVYFNDAHTRGAIFTIRPDGTGLVQLTHRGRVLLDTEPDWSPDGRWIVFMRVKVGVYGRLYKMRSNGTHLTRLDSSCKPENCEDLAPAWSPNGKLIAFTRNDQGTDWLSVMRADGTHVREMTDRWTAGQWSPNGKRMAVGRSIDRGTAVFTIALDGTHARRVTPWKLHAGGGDWSPDGRWILVESHNEQDRQDNLYLVHPNGSDLHQITRSPEHVHQWGSYSFSPDGTMITVSHNLGLGTDPDIVVLNLDGSGLRDVTNSAGTFESAPDWGPRPI